MWKSEALDTLNLKKIIYKQMGRKSTPSYNPMIIFISHDDLFKNAHIRSLQKGLSGDRLHVRTLIPLKELQKQRITLPFSFLIAFYNK